VRTHFRAADGESLSVSIHVDGNDVVIIVYEDDDQLCELSLDADTARCMGDVLLEAGDHADDAPVGLQLVPTDDGGHAG
jgi:hypothetical protein